MLIADSILPYVLFPLASYRASYDLLRFRVGMPSLWAQVDSKNREGAEKVPGVQEPVLESTPAEEVESGALQTLGLS